MTQKLMPKTKEKGLHFIMPLNGVNRLHISIKNLAITTFHSIILGHKKVVRVLIEYSANVDAEDGNKETPLHRAALKGKWITNATSVDPLAACVYALHKYVAHSYVRIDAYKNNIPFPGHEDVVKALIQFGAKVNAETIYKRPALYSAVSAGKSFTYLYCNDFCFIGVSFRYFSGHVKVVRDLIEHGATVNFEDINRVTPLHVATYWGKSTIQLGFRCFLLFVFLL